jgi:hypothetical protein
MSEPLRVLVVTSEPRSADAAVEELEAAGHEIARCTPPGAAPFPCAALDDGCPLDEGAPVDVVLDVRGRPRSQPAPGEAGVTCALQRHIPLVVAGGAALSPFEQYATEVVERPFGVVDACERAARQPLERHSQRAAAALLEVLAARGITGVPARVEVRRERGDLAVHVETARPIEKSVQSMAAVRILGTLREIDRYAAGIDVVFTSRAVPQPAAG